MPEGMPSRRPGFPVGAAALVLLILLLVPTGLYLIFDPTLSIHALEDEIRSWGMLGVVASIGLMILHSFVPFPAEIIAIANGMLYGPVWGVVITWTGAMLGAFAAFGLTRLYGRPFVAHILTARNWAHLDEWTADQAWSVLLIARFIPVIAFNLINYAAGLTRVSWFTFAWTTAIGILPGTTLMVLAGDNIYAMNWLAWSALAIVVIALAWFAQRWISKRRAAKDKS